MNLNDVCDYVIKNVVESGESLSNLKLQKLLYYVQAWYLAFEGKPLVPGKFQAWVHGPVAREIYNRFANTKSLYSDITAEDIRPDFNPSVLTPDVRGHIDRVLSVYAKFSGSQLEELTHREEPWVHARSGLEDWERCDKEIDEGVMRQYYAARLS